MAIKGNYWLDLIARENEFRKEIDAAVRQVVGRCFADYDSLHSCVMDTIRSRLEYYGLNKSLGDFKVDYDVDLKYDDEFCLGGFTIKSVCIVDEYYF